MGHIKNKNLGKPPESVRIISFLGLISIQTKWTTHRAAPYEFAKAKICWFYLENMLSSVLLETAFYQDTLTVNL